MGNSFILELDGKLVGRLFSAESNWIKTEIISAAGIFPRSKLKAPLILGDVTIKFGPDMSRSFYDWITGPLSIPKNGAILVVDARSMVIARFEFLRGLVTSFSLPAVDRSSKSPVFLTASFRPESAQKGPSGSKLTVGPNVTPVQKQWHAANFKFEMDGLNLDPRAVTKISGPALKTFISAYATGGSRVPDHKKGTTSYSNLVVTLPSAKGAGIIEWMEEMVTGNVRSLAPKSATLEYLAPDEKTSYFSAEFSGLIINATSIAKAGTDLTAELSFDSVKFTANSSWAG